MMHTIKKVEYIDQYRLKLQFNDRQTRIVDLKNVLKKAKNMLIPLKNIEYFKRVKTDGITLCWPNGVDLCPDVLYEMGKSVKETKKASPKSKKSSSTASERPQTRIAAKSHH